jgi:hypothetical protein
LTPAQIGRHPDAGLQSHVVNDRPAGETTPENLPACRSIDAPAGRNGDLAHEAVG